MTARKPHGADLHLHTVYSDGVYTPETLVAAAREHDLRAIALTDHDSVDGVEPTRRAARDDRPRRDRRRGVRRAGLR